MVLVREDPGVVVAKPDASMVVIGPDEFCRGIHARLVGSLRLYLGDAELAAELAQDALVRVIERWAQVSTMAAPEAWTYRVAFNLARSRLRRGLAERRAHDRNGPPASASWNVDVAEVLAVRAAVDALPRRQRQAVVLRFYADLTVDQVAGAMDCRPGTVKAHLHQALAVLRTAGLAGPHDVADPDDVARHDLAIHHDRIAPTEPLPASDLSPSEDPT